MNKMIKKYTARGFKFKTAPDGRFISVYDRYNKFKGFLWNNDRVIWFDGDEVAQSEFFK